MSKELILVYQTDNWHNNKVLIAICEEKQVAIEIIRQFVWDTYKALLTDHDEYLLNTIGQTQGDSDDVDNPFEGEFMIEEVKTNTILI